MKSEAVFDGRKWAVLSIILLSYLMTILDVSIVITSLPKIQDELHFTADGLSWVQSAYTLALGGLLLLGARAGDLFGRKKMFTLGLLIFVVASAAIGFAESASWLICARAVQGLGAAILSPATLSLLYTNFPEGPERTRAVSYYGAISGVGASLGLVVGGLIADSLSWRVGFFINVPIGILLYFTSRKFLEETPVRSGKLDLMGAILSTLGMFILVYGIVRSATAGWSDIGTISALSLGAALLLLFVLVEKNAVQPIMPLRLFADRGRVGAYAGRMLFIGSMMGFWFFLTLYLQGVMGFSALQAGLAFLPATISNFSVALFLPRLLRKFGVTRLPSIGLAISLTGMFWLGHVSATSNYFAAVMLPMILVGIGQACTLSPLITAGVVGVHPNDAGAASGLVSVAQQLGGSLGLGILIVVFHVTAGGETEDPTLLAHGVAAVMESSSVMVGLALIVVFFLISLRKKHTTAIT
ncbi:MFS transporter [Pseudomonas gingeri]|uniref:MFS transporter n=1 Tax=Pseudomonas gingeri TaxID=117681 RepID=A0A7Y8C1K2_9PSED|nr:MFS transporter [Pseudomonas gingeri]NWA28627.1 MFS transporter [Pseudomonas gingeri]NWB95704.1 MFS transporter [Pseudomonas gingeri]